MDHEFHKKIARLPTETGYFLIRIQLLQTEILKIWLDKGAAPGARAFLGRNDIL